MAYCPKRRAEINAAATVCPHCGYDFPLDGPEPFTPRRDFAHSTLANIALIVGMIAAGFGCAGTVLGLFVSISNGEWFNALVICPIAFFLQLAMLVVFVRVQRI
jgi:hypothetical protein